MGRRPILCLTVSLLLAGSVAAQQPAFDVASVKENQSGTTNGYFRFLPDGSGVRAEHFPAFNLVTLAFDVRRFQVSGVPDWSRSTYYDVLARPEAPAARPELFAMLRMLLIERFKLQFHREPREVDGYVLQRLRQDRLGSGLQPSTIDCSTREAQMNEPRCRPAGLGIAALKQNGVPVWTLLQVLIGETNAPIEDQTGLSGTFDVDLKWSNDIAPTGDFPSIYTAVQEQLGLKLERRRVTVDGFVIDRFERPDPD